MRGAGYFKQRLNDAPASLDSALDRIPLRDEVKKTNFDSFTAAYKWERAGIGTGSRLLAMKRHDLFICIESKNRSGIADACGVSALSLQTSPGYWDLMQRIWRCPWHRSPRPHHALQIRIWNARAALLDSIYYVERVETFAIISKSHLQRTMSPRPGHTQAIALWHAHNELCPYCNNPIDSFAALEVDHIIPEKMLNTPLELKTLLAQLGTPDLDLNSYRNWLPVHGRPCNRRKGDQQLPVPTLLNYLSLAAKFEGKAKQEEQKLKKQALSNRAFDPILHLIEVGDISKDEAISFIRSALPNATQPRKSEPLVLSFSVNMNALQEPGRLPPDAPETPVLYDWLIGQLEQALRVTGGLFSAIENDRNGETVSIRFASWMLDLDRLSLPLPFGWELLEVMPYSEVYPGRDSENFFAQGVAARHKELTIDDTSSDPFPYKRCPKCTSPKLERSSVRVNQDDVPFIFCTVCGWSTV